jgi:hypothetical protein
MATLISVVAIVGALCLIDLLLTLGVIRRLREHTAMFTTMQPREMGVTALNDGEFPQPFRATDADSINVKGPAGLRIVAFFSTTCPVCPVRVPTFADYVRAHPVGQDEALAVVTGEPDGWMSYLADLAEVAHVCTEELGGPISRAFAVQGFPAFFVLGADGAVQASGHDPAELPTPIAA